MTILSASFLYKSGGKGCDFRNSDVSIRLSLANFFSNHSSGRNFHLHDILAMK